MSRRTETAYKAKFPGELAQHNEAQWFRGYGKCCGCIAKVCVLIRGDLSDMRSFDSALYGNMQSDQTEVSRGHSRCGSRH